MFSIRRISMPLAIALLAFTLVADPVASQPPTVDSRQQAIADRFLQVLIRRPRPGTALDRVYGFHVQNDSLDQLVEQLDDASADPETAGARKMILGLIQLQRGNAAEAVEALSEAEPRLPEDAACSYYLGRALLAVGQTEQAAAAMERAIERNPARNEALAMFTDLGRMYQRAGLREKALAVWTRLEELFPGDVRVGGQIARALAEEGDYEAALERYLRLSQSARDQEDQIAFAIEAAQVRRSLGDDEQALADLETILERLRPGSWLYRDVRGRIENGFLRSGDYDALADYYQQRLEKRPDDLSLQTRLGRILMTAGRLDEAKSVLQSALERAPNDTDVRLTLIDLLVSKGEIKSASQQFEQLAEQDPENPDYLLRWGQTLLEDPNQEVERRRDEAAKIWQRLADARSDDAVTLSQIADRMRSIEREKAAIELYSQAIEIDPTSPQYREYLGEYLYELDRKDEAIEVWEAIAEEPRRNRESLVRLAEVFTTFDLAERALEVWKEAAELDLTFAQEIRYAGQLREAEQHEEALKRLQRAEQLAESFDEREQLLRERIATYQDAGTLQEQIDSLQDDGETTEQLRTLALMHQAAGNMPDAAKAIKRAKQQAPEDVDVLIVAADIAEKQNRLVDAVQLATQLAETDNRFRTNHLQRKANLQMRLGQVDDSLQTCEALIKANPASSESYQFLARLAFRAGRNDQGVTALRRAMSMAPRDNSPRRMLASHFADLYRTDEAIELHWQSMRTATETQDRISIVQQLAPLYDRKADFEELIRRLEELGRKENDPRSLQLLIAAAYEQVQNYEMAGQTIEQLLAEQPRDVTLLETMVRLSNAMGNVVEAAEYQKRITGLADTPVNRMKLVELQLDAGLIDVETALSQRIDFASDPGRIAGMIRSAIARSDFKTAKLICREAIRRDPGSWESRLTLAQLLLLDATVDDEKGLLDEAIQLAGELRQMDISADELPAGRQQRTSNNTNSAMANYRQSPRYWTSTNYELARTHRIGQYANYNYGYSTGSQLISPLSFGHARAIAGCLQLIAASRQSNDTSPAEAAKKFFEANWPQSDVSEFQDAADIWEYKTVSSCVSIFQSGNNRLPGSPAPDKEFQEALTWRLAELDPQDGGDLVLSLLMSRLQREAQSQSQSSVNAAQSAGDQDAIEPLTESQLATLLDVYRHKTTSAATTATMPSSMAKTILPFVMRSEFRRAGKPERAEEFAAEPPQDEESYVELSQRLAFHLQMNQVERAEEVIPHLLPAIRAGRLQPPSGSIYPGSLGAVTLRQGSDEVNQFNEKHRLTLIDSLFASRVAMQTQASRRSSSPGEGVISVHMRMPAGVYRSVRVKAPLSTRLLDSSLVSGLGVFSDVDRDSNQQSLRLPTSVIDHLAQPLPDAPREENKARGVVAAFAHWWDERPEECYAMLDQLCETYPEDVDLQIERARLASELKQPRLALKLLDGFDPLDSKMLVRKEMAAMNLAVQVGDRERVKQAAERLFGLRMDTNTQLALAAQLKRLGMDDKATAILKRLRGGRHRSESVELQIANAFLANDQQESAAEVAYSLLKRLSTGRSQNRNAANYRRQAVQILKNAGRLEGLIEQAQRRVEAAPGSYRARTQLAELYTAAGRAEDAAKVWEGITDQPSANPQQLVLRAAALVKGKKYEQAVDTYLDAFEKQPQLFSNHYYDMRRAVQQGNQYDTLFTRLAKFNLNTIPGYRIQDLVQLNASRNKTFSDAKLRFVRRALKHDYVRSNFYRIVDQIPDSEVSKIPEIREVMVAAICSDDAFSPTSTLWRVSSRSSGGRANGPLKTLMEMLTKDDVVAAKFLAAAEQAQQSSSSQPSAEFLIGLHRITKDPSGESEETDEAVAMLKKQLGGDAVDRNQINQLEISGGLLWQAGQLLEEKQVTVFDDKPKFLINLYETALNDPQVRSSSSFPYSVNVRLINVYVQNGQDRKARELLLDAYRTTDHSSQNQHNPGYGDYQEINDFNGIADLLVKHGFALDALSIRNAVLADTAKFERATRWGGSNRRRQWEKSRESTKALATGKKAVQYLNLLLEDIEQQGTGANNDDEDTRKDVAESTGQPRDLQNDLAIDWLDVGVDPILAGESKATIVIALDEAFDDGFVKRWLPDLIKSPADKKQDEDVPQWKPDDFVKRIDALSEKRPHDWSLPALKAAILAAVKPDQTADVVDELLDRVPAPESFGEADELEIKHRSLVGLYSVAAWLNSIDAKEHQGSIAKLADYIRSIGQATNEPNFVLATTRLTGESPESLESYIEQLVEVTANRPATPTEAETCLKIAKTTVQAGDIDLSTRALKLALGAGPPLKPITAEGDAFALRQNNSRTTSPSSAAQGDAEMQEVIQELHSLVGLYEQHTGYSLLGDPDISAPSGATKASKDSQAEESEQSTDPEAASGSIAVQPEAIHSVYEALDAIVFPEEMSGRIFAYEKPLLSLRGYDNFNSSKKFTPTSIATALAHAAVAAGKTDEFFVKLNQRQPASADLSLIGTMRVRAAVALDDSERLEEAITKFANAIDKTGMLPSEAPKTNANPLNVITSSIQQESYKKTEVLDRIVRTLLPLVEEDHELTDEASGVVHDILLRSTYLINSDSYTQNRHRRIAERLRRLSIATASKNGDKDQVQRLVDTEISLALNRYNTYSGNNRERLRRNALRTLANSMIRDDLTEYIPELIRHAHEVSESTRQDFESPFIAHLVLAVNNLSSDQRLKFLQHVVLGKDGKGPIRREAGIVRYTPAPPVAAAATVDTAAIKQLPLLAKDVPLTGTLLMLADVAARQGETRAIADAIANLRKETGDQADLVELIVRLTEVSQKSESITDPQHGDLKKRLEETLQVVGNELRASVPKETKNEHRFPTLEFYLVVRAMDAGLPVKQAEPLLRDLRMFGLRGSQRLLVSVIERVRAHAGLGRAAGATTESPLDDYIAVSIPMPNIHPATPTLAPLYAENEGWISGTSGYNVTILMYKYPVIGDFEFSATITDGGWGEADVAYDGILYQAQGFNQKAVTSHPSRGNKTVIVPSIEHNVDNTEAIKVRGKTVEGIVNGKKYVHDVADQTFPWVGICQYLFRTTRFKDVKLTGSPQIPRQVDLIGPRLRGWVSSTSTLPLPSPDIPASLDPPKTQSTAKASASAKRGWGVNEAGELTFHLDPSHRRFDTSGAITYLRPLLDKETLECSFWWEQGKTELRPILGRLQLGFSEDALVPIWLGSSYDLAYSEVRRGDSEPLSPLETQNLPIDGQWNKLQITRQGDQLIVKLNDKPLIEIPVTTNSQLGFGRPPSCDVKIRSLRLTGDWPESIK